MKNWVHLTTLSLPVPVRSAGNIITNTPVEFDVYKDGDSFKAVPFCDEDLKKSALLKPELIFSFHPGKAISDNGIMDGNQHIIESIGEAMKEKGLA